MSREDYASHFIAVCLLKMLFLVLLVALLLTPCYLKYGLRSSVILRYIRLGKYIKSMTCENNSHVLFHYIAKREKLNVSKTCMGKTQLK